MNETNPIPKKLFLFVFYFFSMYILSTIIAILLFITLRYLFPNNPNNNTFAMTITNIVIYSILSFVILFTLDRYFAHYFKDFKKKFLYYVGLAIAGWIFNLFLTIIIEIIMQLLEFTSRETQNQEAIVDSLKYPLLAIPVIIFGAPIVEEIIFRGIIFNYARNLKLPKKLNIVLAFILSSSLFGLIHVFTAFLQSHDYTELILGIPYISAGFVLTLLYYLTNNIFVPMLMHFIQNCFSVFLILILPYLPMEPPSKIVYILSQLIPFI